MDQVDCGKPTPPTARVRARAQLCDALRAKAALPPKRRAAQAALPPRAERPRSPATRRWPTAGPPLSHDHPLAPQVPLSEYEQERLANIRANNEKLAELGLGERTHAVQKRARRPSPAPAPWVRSDRVTRPNKAVSYAEERPAPPVARARTAPSVRYCTRTPAQWDQLAAQFHVHGRHMLDQCPLGRAQVAPWRRAPQRAETLKSVCGEWRVTSLYEDQLTLAPALPAALAPPRGAFGLPPAGTGYAGRRDCSLRADGRWEARAIRPTHSLTMMISVCHALPSGLAEAFHDWLWAAAALSGLQGMVQGIDVYPSASLTRYSLRFAEAATSEQRGLTGDAIWRRVVRPGGAHRLLLVVFRPDRPYDLLDEYLLGAFKTRGAAEAAIALFHALAPRRAYFLHKETHVALGGGDLPALQALHMAVTAIYDADGPRIQWTE